MGQAPAAHIPTLLEAMREGKPYPVKAFLVFGNNTLSTYANTALVYESLMKLDFMVCADLFMTPTAELADMLRGPSSTNSPACQLSRPMSYWRSSRQCGSVNVNRTRRFSSN